MTLLDKYISVNFVRLSLLTTLLTSFMMTIVEMFIRFQFYSSLKAGQMITLVLMRFPSSMSFVVGPSLLFATTYFISSLYSNNEFISFLSAGISYKRIIAPIIAIAVLFTGALFAFNEKVRIPFDVKYNQKRLEYTDATDSYMRDNRNVALSDRERNVTIRANKYTDSKQRLEKLDIVTFTPENTLKEKITADSAEYDESKGVWVLKRATVRAFDLENIRSVAQHHNEYIVDSFRLEPRFFRAEGEDVSVMSIPDSISYLRTVKHISSQMHAEKSTDFYKRMFTPFTALIMILISLSSNLKNKKNALMYSIISSLALGVAYYAMDMAFTLMAKQSLISPFAAMAMPLAGISAIALIGAARVST